MKKVELKKVFLRWINILPQPRKTFSQIEELAENIATQGLFNPIGVAKFNYSETKIYLEVINAIWKTDFQIKKLFSVANNFYILVDGERRIRALTYLWDNGCQTCLSKYGKEQPGTCFNRHFPKQEVPVSLLTGFSPEKILERQFSENIHEPVPPAEEAEGYQNFFRFLRQSGQKISIAEFARRVGRSPQIITRALAFCELPDLIQEAAKKPVKQGGISYGIALQLTRLQKAGMDEKNLIWWATRALVSNYKIKKMKELVDAKLREFHSGQSDLFGIMNAEQEKEMKKALIKKTVEKNVIKEIWAYISYFRSVLGLFESGDLGLESSPFSEKSPRRVYLELINLMHDQLFSHMEKILKTRKKSAAEILQQAKEIAAKL